jgi:hypothetical protein
MAALSISAISLQQFFIVKTINWRSFNVTWAATDNTWRRSRCVSPDLTKDFFPTLQRPIVGQGLLIIEASQSHSDIQHSMTTLDEWSARRRDFNLTTHNNHKKEITMLQAGFAPAIPASERPQAHTCIRPLKWRLMTNSLPILHLERDSKGKLHKQKASSPGDLLMPPKSVGYDTSVRYSWWSGKRVGGRSQVYAVFGTAIFSLPLKPHWPSGSRLYDPMGIEQSSYCHTSLYVFKAWCLNRRITFIAILAGLHKTQHSASFNNRKF